MEYLCHKCKIRFYESQAGVRSEVVSTDPYYLREMYDCCPKCGSDDIDEIIEAEWEPGELDQLDWWIPEY